MYGRIVDARNALYERGIWRSHSLEAKTISIGNITAGGTGKTPLVAYVAMILAEAGEKVCILTRGYGRANPRQRVLVSDGENVLTDARTGGDEPVELARRLIGKAVVVADADRVSAGKWAKGKFGITAFVLDDGFQHRKVKRDLDIVCVDATNPFGNGQILPAGILRERVANLRRADAVVLTRADLIDNIEDLKSQISNLAPDSRVFVSENRIAGKIELSEFLGQTEPKNTNAGIPKKVLAFCGIGNPENFYQLLGNNGFELAGSKNYPDHFNYRQLDITELEKRARIVDVETLLTTAKDAVKLKDMKFEIPCYVVEIETVLSDAAAFRNMIISY